MNLACIRYASSHGTLQWYGLIMMVDSKLLCSSKDAEADMHLGITAAPPAT